MADSNIVQQALAKLAAQQAPTPLLPAESQPAPLQPEVVESAPVAVEPVVTQPVLPASTRPAYTPEIPAPAPLNPGNLSPEQQTAIAQKLDIVPAPMVSPGELTALEVGAAAASEPTAEEINLAVNKFMQPERQARAASLALDKIDELQRQAAVRQAEREKLANEQMEKINARVRSMSIPEVYKSGSFGQKLGASIAIALGGAAQGLQGLKSNPVVDFMNSIAEQQAVRDKLSNDEKQMLQHNLYQQSQAELQKLENATQNAYRKDQIRLLRDELAQKAEATRQQLLAKFYKDAGNTYKYSGKALTQEQYASLSPEERRSVVTLPNAKRVMAANPTDAREYQKFAGETGNALSAVKELLSLAEKMPKSKALSSPVEYAKAKNRAKVLQQVIVGGLRLPFTGPGVLTDTEREQLINTIGSPLDIFSIKSFELAKLGQVQKSLEANLTNTARNRGIMEDVIDKKYYNVNGRAIREDDLVQLYKQKMPGLDEEKIRRAIQLQVPAL